MVVCDKLSLTFAGEFHHVAKLELESTKVYCVPPAPPCRYEKVMKSIIVPGAEHAVRDDDGDSGFVVTRKIDPVERERSRRTRRRMATCENRSSPSVESRLSDYQRILERNSSRGQWRAKGIDGG